MDKTREIPLHIRSAFLSALCPSAFPFEKNAANAYFKILPPSKGYTGNKLTIAIDSEEAYAVSVNAYMVG